jgi:hypothetical protein
MPIDTRQKMRGALAGLAIMLLVAPAAAATLITEHEAQLPPDASKMRSGIERGPDIVAVYPAAETGLIQSPFNFRVKFEPHGGTRIDLDSLVVTYKRIPSIDLTARLRAFTQPGGIDMPGAEVPPGSHRIWIFIKDTAGHEARAEINFSAGP